MNRVQTEQRRLTGAAEAVRLAVVFRWLMAGGLPKRRSELEGILYFNLYSIFSNECYP